MKQIFIGIGGKSQFREDRQDRFLLCRFFRQFNCFLGIKRHIGNLDFRNADSGADKSVGVKIEKAVFERPWVYPFST